MKSSEKSFFRKTGVRIIIPAILILFVSTSLIYSSYKRSVERNDVIMSMVMQLTERGHVSPAKINDQFSEKVFDAYLKKLDPFKWFLTMEDIRQMEVYRRQIDDHIRSNTHRLYELAVKLMDKRIIEVQGYYREILSVPFNFTIDETWEIDRDKRDWPANSAELKESWRKYLKYQVLTQTANALKAQEKETDPAKIKALEAIESDARQRELKRHNDVFLNNLDQQQPEEKFAIYVNSIMTVFDPHTEYFSPSNKEKFEQQISGQFEGIGATLQPSDGYAKVVKLEPGSPSWKQGELKVNDHITRVKQENEVDPVDIFGMSLNDAVKLIRGKKGTNVTLTVKRGDGSFHEITITRGVVTLEETYAKSVVLTDPSTKTKVGYINLPGFYGDPRIGKSVTKDVTKEIENLKKEGIQGIILDLRFNTGGLLFEAVMLGGLFIESGPIVQVKEHIGSPQIHNDPDPSIQYDGPLAILVNTFSASASEIVSAAMQDYKRAVIIGSSATFGKGTAQYVIDLDRFLPAGMSAFRPIGSLHLTTEKYYRINGGSTQLKGVASDIVFPDLYGEMKIGEQYDDFCLPWSTVSSAKFRTWGKPVPVTMLQKKSQERTSKSEGFILLNEQVALMKEQRDKTLLSLNLKTFQQEEEKRREENKRFEEISKLSTSLTIAATVPDIAEMKDDTAKIARSDRWIKDLNKDIFLEEAVKVIGDMK